jgi:hypothetical protein
LAYGKLVDPNKDWSDIKKYTAMQQLIVSDFKYQAEQILTLHPVNIN